MNAFTSLPFGRRAGVSLALFVAGAGLLHADFSYQQTTKITGGSMLKMPFVGGRLKEPVTNSVMVKGNRMIHMAKDRATVIDVDKETFTEINFEKKTYSVMTFEEMKQAMDALAQKMSQMQGEQRQQMPEMTFKASVNDTGVAKDVNGVSASQQILTLTSETVVTDEKTGMTHTMGSVMDSDMWMAADIPGFDEVRQFQVRMGEKFGRVFGGASALAISPGLAKGYAEMAKETSKLKGIPVLQNTKVVQTIDGRSMAGFGGMPQMPSVKSMAGNAAGDAATSAALGRMGRAGGLAGGLGGLGGLGRKKKEEQPAPPQQQQQAPPADAGPPVPAIETSMEMSGFSSAAVDASKFEVPAGFKQVESEMKKLSK